MARLIETLAVVGSRKSDGTANASGKVFLYSPGTTTIVPGYKDDQLSQSWTTTNGGIPLDVAGKVKIWINGQVDVVVQDSSGATVDTMLGFNKVRAEQVEVENASYTGALTDSSGAVTQALGGKTDLSTLLTSAATSLGDDFKYKESGGATSRSYIEVISQFGISVMDFGAVGNGIADDTTAFQKAITRATQLSTVVLAPAGTFKTSAALTVTSATGVQIIGKGHAATIIAPTAGAANAFTFSSCTGSGIHGLSILHSTGSTGAGVAASACPNFSASDVVILADATYVGFAYGMDFSGAGTIDYLSNCYEINGTTRAIRIANAGISQPQVISGCQIGASSAAPRFPPSALEFSSATGTYYLSGNNIVGGTNNILFSGSMTGVRIIGNDVSSALGSTPFGGAGAALLPQIGNGVYGTTIDVTSGGTATPDLTKGNHIRIRATSTGAAITIAAPTPAPSASQYGVLLFLDIFNNAGGALSNPYTMNAVYHLSTVPNQTDLNHNQYVLIWDPNSSVWRQLSLSVTT